MRKITTKTIALFAGIITLSSVTFISAKPVNAALLSVNNEAAVSYYYALPATVRGKLESRGVNFEVNDNKVYYQTGDSRAVGVTHTNAYSRSGKIASQEIFVKNGYEDAILHEAGHCMASYNDIFEYWTNCIGWQTIYNEEVCNAVNAGMDSSNLYNRDEFFAECFQLYITNPQSLQANCPQAFNYIQAVIMAP